MIYGYGGTIHGTNHVNVEVSKKGEVVSVWFRCMPIPFDQSIAGPEREVEMRRMYNEQAKHNPKLVAVDVRRDDDQTEGVMLSQLLDKNGKLQIENLKLSAENSKLKDDLETMSKAFVALRIIADRYSK